MTCEWNPAEDRPAHEDEVHAQATTCISWKGSLHLCDACAALPRFKRFKKHPLKSAIAGPATPEYARRMFTYFSNEEMKVLGALADVAMITLRNRPEVGLGRARGMYELVEQVRRELRRRIF